LYPQFATHNALTIASLIEQAGGIDGYEFQRLHGMGEALHERVLEKHPAAWCRIYAPVGAHRDLLAYLVRRLLENGANSSFVALVADPAIDARALLKRPASTIEDASKARNPDIALPRNLFAPHRRNSRGVEFGDRRALAELRNEIDPHLMIDIDAAPIIGGEIQTGERQVRVSPIDGAAIGTIVSASTAQAVHAMDCAQRAAAKWDNTPVAQRAAALEAAGDLLEKRRGRFIALLQAEGGKTLDDALSEVREAIDFCRYYAVQARSLLGESQSLPGPTGESNVLRWRSRGVFVCIAPWNFPLAIFLGQIAAALAAGNAVVAKPAEQTPLIAFETVRLLHEAGVPQNVLHLVTGAGVTGAALVAHPAVAGVAFTGSTETAWKINRALAAKDGPIAALIAETGGINAMIADATALPEQICDDVIASAFRSTGQRCSALRLLCLQEDIADHTLAMIAGAARELKVGDPRDPSTHLGPVIDGEALAALRQHLASLPPGAQVVHAGQAGDEERYLAPHIVGLKNVGDLQKEVFGPILHVVTWRADGDGTSGGLDDLLEAIDALGFGLTLGVHSRINETIRAVCARLKTGNIYVNRSMIGAVVGSQPFGGNALSGTGPKAGGPAYLTRFAIEQTVSTNTAAAGGNVSLLAGNAR
jgi:RHH-type transcriptional regulator, proline utilization regulon repressor / proline dehydrogenase / delta 1-pyrroline-5-carboxylate dehydrogenase